MLCSHEHRDHNGKEAVTLRQGMNSPFTVRTIDTWHDDQQGTLRGSNLIHILDDGQFTVAHLGDLGCELMQSQIEELEGLDALLIPVGGYYTIDAVQARAVVEKLRPNITVPMHYRGENFGYDVLETVDAFVTVENPVVRYGRSWMSLDKNSSSHIALLEPQNKPV